VGGGAGGSAGHGSPVAVGGTTATFKGELNHGGVKEKVAYHFAYSEGAGAGCSESGHTAPAAGPFTQTEEAKKKVSVAVTGLEGSTAYTVCLVAANPAEETEATVGNAVTFTTTASVPVVGAERPSGKSRHRSVWCWKAK